MKALLRDWLVLGMAVALDAQIKPPSTIQVLVYNYTGVSAEALARAEREAARIYSRAGIQTEWIDCPLSPAEAAYYPACDVPVSPTRLALRLLSRRLAERAGLAAPQLGAALFPEDGGFGMIAQVCSSCLETLAKGRAPRYASILGHVMAHELGHLLLGVRSHSSAGLMHVPWHKGELERAAQGLLLFAAWEGEKMRRQVSARLGAEIASAKHK